MSSCPDPSRSPRAIVTPAAPRGQVGERALRTIRLTEEAERYNIYVSLLNLEKAHGDEASLAAMFQRAIAGTSSALPLYLHMASVHERAGDVELADATYRAASRKFAQRKAVWLGWLGSLMARKETDEAKKLLQRSGGSMRAQIHSYSSISHR